MVMKKNVFIIALGIISLSVFAGNEPKASQRNSSAPASLTVVVTDRNSGEALPGVLVTIKESGEKLFTDLDGKFEIKGMPAGTYTLSASYISYKELASKAISLTPGTASELVIELTPDR